MSAGDTFTSTSIYSNGKLEDAMSNEMREKIDTMILDRIHEVVRLNGLSDEDLIEEIMEDEYIYDLVTTPSDEVTEAYKFKYEL